MNPSAYIDNKALRELFEQHMPVRPWDNMSVSRPRQNGKSTASGYTQHPHHVHVSMDFNTNTRESNTMDRTAVIAAEIARLQEELASRARFGADHEDGTILSWNGTFANNSRVYSYAALRAGGTWHLTGSQAQSNLSWDALVSFLQTCNATNVSKHGKGKVIAEQ